MKLNKNLIEKVVNSIIKKHSVIALGASSISEEFLKKIALKSELEDKKIKIVPSCFHIAAIASSLGLTLGSPDIDVDLSIEFASNADKNFNFIKNNTHSLIRDKIIARMAKELIVIIKEENIQEILNGVIPFEISKFSWKLTMADLENFGKTKLRLTKTKPFLTETRHYIVDVEIDKVHSLNDIEFEARRIPGVLETGLFLGYADKALVIGKKKIELKNKKGFPGLELIEIIE